MKEKKKNPKGIYEKVPGSGVFWIRYADASGKIRREKCATKGLALKLYQKRKTEVLEGKKLPETLRAKRITFKELADDALEYSKTHKRSFADDEIRMAKLVESFGNTPADSITPQDIERWLTSRPTLKPATLNRYRALLCLLFRLGIQNGKMKTNPARMVHQRRENNARIRFLLGEEEARLRAVVSEQWHQHLPELEIALNTGLRKSEQYSLTWNNIDLERMQATILTTKNGEVKYVPLNYAALNAFRELQTRSNGQPWVFTNRYGEKMQSPREWFEKALMKARITNFHWHDLRHTFASRLAMASVDLRTIQQLMGHRTIQMTVRYAHLAPEHQLAAVGKLCDTGSTSLEQATDTKTSTGTVGASSGTGQLVQ